MPALLPDAGDLIWLTLRSAGRARTCRRRPAVVLSSKPYNQKAGRRLSAR